MTKARAPHILISYFEKKYKEVYGVAPILNRHRDKWGFQDMIEDLGEARARDVIDWYLGLDTNHSVRGLLMGYDLYNMRVEEAREEAERMAEVRRRTEEKVLEFRKKREQIEQSRSQGTVGGNQE